MKLGDLFTRTNIQTRPCANCGAPAVDVDGGPTHFEADPNAARPVRGAVVMAVEFTAVGGDRAGQRVRRSHPDRQFMDWYATKYLPPETKPQVVRAATCGEWEET